MTARTFVTPLGTVTLTETQVAAMRLGFAQSKRPVHYVFENDVCSRSVALKLAEDRPDLGEP
jgi:hypothetical protein